MPSFKSNAYRKNKYGNHKVEYDGIKFDSKKELRRYFELKAMQENGDISDLRVHESFRLIVPGLGAIKYRGLKRTTVARFVPDFVYKERGKLVVEDVKSPATAKEKYFRLKKAVFELIYDTEVRIV